MAMISDVEQRSDNNDISVIPSRRSGEDREAEKYFTRTPEIDNDISKSNLLPLPLWKRSIDIAGALLGLLLLSLPLLLVSLLIKTVSRGPVIFKQKRVGCMGRPFTMWKFRTMKVDADCSTHKEHLAHLINGSDKYKPMKKLEYGTDFIPFGKVMRRLHIDELPQLFNVLGGTMSLVGPRPPIPYEVDEYCDWHKKRLEAVPGMTGLWQVSGKNCLTFDEMVQLDIRYVKSKSLWFDMKIILVTPFVILSQINGGKHNE